MKFLMKLLGYLTGKTKVACNTCKNLIEGKCYGKITIPPEEQNQEKICGFWQAKK